MINYNKETPILLVAFGSIETIQQIFNQLQRIEPQRLYLVYNTPSSDEQTDIQAQIESVFNNIQWECKLKILRNKSHSSYNAAMQKAIRWFFRQEAEGIVLNGFSVPFPAFYAFSSCVLEKYRHDERIGHISGLDFRKPNPKSKTSDSYYFSKLVHVSSGWTSWRRVWQDMNAQLKTFSTFKRLNVIEQIPSHKPFRNHWHYWNEFKTNLEAQYEYVNLINNRLSVVPNMRQIPINEYTLPEINHPAFIVNPVNDELLWQEQKYSIPAITPYLPDGVTFLLKKLLSYNAEAGKRIKIPRIIHQIYEDPAGPPANLLNIAETWKENHPGWEYLFWNRQKINDFLESTCPDFLDYYRAYPFNVQRWDAIRYLILYHIGGMYIDLDYECIRPFDVLLTGSTCCMGMEPTLHNLSYYNKPLLVGNALMASVPKHPYMAAIIEDMKTNFKVDYQKSDSRQIMETTGPLMVTRVYTRYKKKEDATLLPADLVAPLSIKEVRMLRTGHARPDVLKKVEKSFAIHYFFSSWLPQTAEGKAWQKLHSK